jgi:hypothetical protein
LILGIGKDFLFSKASGPGLFLDGYRELFTRGKAAGA